VRLSNPKRKIKNLLPFRNKKYPNPQADTNRQEISKTMKRKLNIDNGLQGLKTERQLVASYIKHLAVSGLSSIVARIKGTCNLTGQCFEIGNKNIPLIR